MKTTSLLALGLLAMSLCAFSAVLVVVPGSINFANNEVSEILGVYRTLTGMDLVVDSRVKTVHHLITLQAKGASHDEEVKLIEKALIDQAGVVITRLDDKRASVTYNDA